VRELPRPRREVGIPLEWTLRQPALGDSRTVNEGETATLSATASDPDGNPVGYHRTQMSGPEIILSDAYCATPSFAAPVVTRLGDSVVLRVTVDDGFGGIASDGGLRLDEIAPRRTGGKEGSIGGAGWRGLLAEQELEVLEGERAGEVLLAQHIGRERSLVHLE
jgi:hypothetical protein